MKSRDPVEGPDTFDFETFKFILGNSVIHELDTLNHFFKDKEIYFDEIRPKAKCGISIKGRIEDIGVFEIDFEKFHTSYV